MAVEQTDLAELDASTVQQNLAEIQARVQENNPTLHVQRGVLHDLVLYQHALLTTQDQANIERWRRSATPQQIAEDPTLADDDVVEDAFNRWNVERQDGSAAQGEVTIVVTDDTTVTVAAGSIWEANGYQFTADAAYVAKAEADQINVDTDRLLTELDDGNFAFTIEVTATEDGTGPQLPKDTTLVPQVTPVNFLVAYAANDFFNGRDLETNAEMLTRQQEGVAAKALSGRLSMQATLLDRDEFTGLVAQSIVGMGDAEMLRDRHTIFPFGFGGRVDWYVRTQERLDHTVLTKTATLISKSGSEGTWQFSLARDEAPGCYEIGSIRLTSAANLTGSFEITSDTRGYDVTGSGFIPDIVDAEEAAYSAYQTLVIQFVDDTTDATALAIGATADYSVEVVGLPLIGDLQELVGGRLMRNCMADAMVKAPVPCFLQISATIHKKSTEASPDLDAIKTALCEEVNRVGFLGVLYASQLHNRIHQHLTGDQSVGALDLFARLRTPAGVTRYMRSDEVIEIEDAPGEMVTSQTVQFLCEPADVALDVATTLPVPL